MTVLLSQELCSALRSRAPEATVRRIFIITSGEEGGAEAKGKRRDADFFNISRISGTGQVGCITAVLFRWQHGSHGEWRGRGALCTAAGDR